MKRIAIDVDGHQAHIEYVGWRMDYQKDDSLVVRISFDESVDGTYGFIIQLPADGYYSNPGEFLSHVGMVAETRLKAIHAERQAQHACMDAKRNNEDALNRKVAEIKDLIGLD